MKIYLFDIDGTLLQSHGLGGKALDSALREVTGKTYDIRKIDWFGNTDGAVLMEILADMGYPGAELERLKLEIFARFVEKLRENDSELRGKIKILPGVVELLTALEGACVGLVTGNIRETAYLKLAAVGLGRYFPEGVGGFGDDRDVRSELIPIAVERARLHYAADRFDKVVVFGDSHRDIIAAKDNCAVCIAVATGKLKSCELAGYQPDYIFEDFSDTPEVIKVLNSI